MPTIKEANQQSWCINMIWLITIVGLSGEYLVKGGKFEKIFLKFN